HARTVSLDVISVCRSRRPLRASRTIRTAPKEGQRGYPPNSGPAAFCCPRIAPGVDDAWTTVCRTCGQAPQPALRARDSQVDSTPGVHVMGGRRLDDADDDLSADRAAEDDARAFHPRQCRAHLGDV